MFSKMKTGTKVLVGFAVAAGLMLVVGLVGYWSTAHLSWYLEDVGKVRMMALNYVEEISRGGEKVKAAQRTLLNTRITPEVRARQYENVANARKIYDEAWKLYEALPKTPEEAQLWQQVVITWGEWGNANNEFFRMMKEFESLGLGDPYELRDSIINFSQDHFRLISNTAEMLFSKQVFQGGEDHTACAFGRWKAQLKLENPELKAILTAIDEPHRKFHEAIKKAKQLVSGGQGEQAQQCFKDELLPAAEAVQKGFQQLNALVDKALERVQQAEHQAMAVCRQKQQTTNDLLDKLIKLNRDIAVEEADKALAVANTATTLMIGVIVVGLVFLGVLGVLIAKSISKVLAALVGQTRQLTEAAVQGKLDTRGDVQTVTLEFRPIIEGFNATLDAVVDPLKMAAQYVDRISRGDIPPKITDTYHGDFNTIKENLNRCVETLDGLIAEMRRMSDEHNRGDIDVTIPAEKFQGAYREMAQGLNEMVAAHIAVNKKAMACVAEFGKGNFDAPLEKFPGKKAFINETIEEVRNNLKNVSADAVALAKAAENGQLDARADENKYAGAWREIIRGVNNILAGFARPMEDVATVLQRLAQKDFTRGVENQYPGAYGKLCEDVNTVVESIRKAMEQLVESANQFAEGSRVIAESSQTLAQGAQTQSSSVEEITASIEELARSIEAVRQNASEATTMATQANQVASEGGKAVQRSIESMEQIRTSSQQISEIIQVISEIASQTNLLALNAAIEAARAGEHGMGFAVVADEVRKLAERSNQAAREISTLIKESTKRVEEGAQLSDQTGESLRQIVKACEATAAKIAEIASATVQQAASSQEVSKAIQGVAQVTEQAAAGSEQMASSSQQLGAQAAALRELVSQFNIGGSSAVHRSEATRK